MPNDLRIAVYFMLAIFSMTLHVAVTSQSAFSTLFTLEDILLRPYTLLTYECKIPAACTIGYFKRSLFLLDSTSLKEIAYSFFT